MFKLVTGYFVAAPSRCHIRILDAVRAAIFRVPPSSQKDAERNFSAGGEEEREPVRLPSVRYRLPHCPVISRHLRHPDDDVGGSKRPHRCRFMACVERQR